MTGLLYFIVIAMWASVLIPIGLKNHDRRSLEKNLGIENQGGSRWHWQTRDELTPRQRAFIRRRRTIMFLLTSLVATIALSTAGTISYGFIAIPVLLIGAFGYAAAKQPLPARPVVRVAPKPAQQNIPAPTVSKVVTTKTVEEKVEVQKRTWTPVETPLPSYVTADRASAYARKIEADRPWTGQEMIDAAVKLREQRAQKLKEAQARLEEARALAMENARRAAMAANQNNGVPVTPFRRAANQ